MTQSTNEATQTEEITKTKNNPEKTNKPRGKVLKTMAKNQSQTGTQNRKRKNTNAQGGSAPKRVQSTKEKDLYLKMIQVLQQKMKRRRGNLF